jgi:hypothetical protein
MGLFWVGFVVLALVFGLLTVCCVFMRRWAAFNGIVSFLRWQFANYSWVASLPLSEAVSFKTLLQRGNRVQVPRVVRWQFKLEPTQVLRVTVKVETPHFTSVSESFYAQMSEDGRITVPLLTLALLQKRGSLDEGLTGHVFEVRIQPAEGSSRSRMEQ